MKRALMVIGIVAAAFVLLTVILGVAATNNAGPLTAEVTDAIITAEQVTETSTESAAPPVPMVPEMKEGVYQVGVDIPAGRYKTTGAPPGLVDSCYWARMRDDTGDFDSLIANDIVNGPGSVTVKEGEFVKLSGGCIWTLSQ